LRERSEQLPIRAIDLPPDLRISSVLPAFPPDLSRRWLYPHRSIDPPLVMSWRRSREQSNQSNGGSSAPPSRPGSSAGHRPGHAGTNTSSSGGGSTSQPGAAASSSSSSSSAAANTASSRAYHSSSLGDYLAPFSTAVSQSLASAHGHQTESSRLLADLAPHIMKPRILAAANSASHSVTSAVSSNALVGFLPIPLSLRGQQGFSITQPARNLVRIGNALRQGPVTSNDLLALESSHQILQDAAFSMSSGMAEQEEQMALMSLSGAAAANGAVASGSTLTLGGNQVSLLRGFEATIPSAMQGRERRRRERAREGPRLGLKQMGEKARGLLTAEAEEDHFEAAEDLHDKRKERKNLRSRAKDVPLSEESLLRQDGEVKKEREDIDVRRRLLHHEIAAVDLKMAALQSVKDSLTRSLMALKEEELELEDETAGIAELISLQRHREGGPATSQQAGLASTPQKGNRLDAGGVGSHRNVTPSSRRRRGPLFLPGEHDELPSNVAFMTLAGHTAPIISLDFSEPYGLLVSSAAESDSSTRVWDLSNGLEVGRLRHDATVKSLQVEDELCITGGTDAKIKLWDLKKVEDWETRLSMIANGEWTPQGRGVPAHHLKTLDEESGGASMDSVRQGEESSKLDPVRDENDPQLKTLEGHSKEVTAVYFDDTCLVSGASDKTLRQWDLNTGQCILTMDLLWAISNPTASQALGVSDTPDSPPSPPNGFPHSPLNSPSPATRRRPPLSSRMSSTTAAATNLTSWSGTFSYPTAPLSDGSWELYTDFVGSSALQFWGYALASGSADGAVRMWDMRTGQAHRTLLGHTAPVTTLQFDEQYLISGSLDKSIRIWDLRSGGIVESIKYDYPISSLQFDSRKILCASGENGVKIYNRTTLQQGSLSINGHTKPVERLRYMDRYAVSGGKDAVVKVWAL